jgi:tRNA-splicing ligase RtcB
MTQQDYDFVDGARFPIKAWTRGVQLEGAAREQLLNIANLPFIHKHVAVMPDVHYGMGATVGSVIATKGAIVPAAVGVDIGCVDSETEYLTPTGWKRIEKYDGSELVLVYDPASKKSWFERPTSHICRPSSGFLHLKTKYGINQALSDDHRVLLYEAGRARGFESYRVESAAGLVARHHGLVQGAGERFKTTPESVTCPGSVDFTDAQLRVIVMTAADAHMEPTSAYLNFRKRRKFDRALELLDAAAVEIVSTKSDCDVYGIRYRKVSEIKGLEQLWGASSDQLKVIADEVLRWDGNSDDRVFFTRRKEEADFVQWAFIAAGKRAVLRADEAEDGKIDYRVFAHENTVVGIKSSPRTNIERVQAVNGEMEYCFTVSTGFFLIRRGGVTALTGNCGMMAVRTSLVASDLPDTLLPLRTAIEAAIPHGRTNNGGTGDRGAWGDVPEGNYHRLKPAMAELASLCQRHPDLERAAARAPQHAGTLGTGNHFVEVCLDEDQAVWLMLHSGSRGIGNRIGSYFIEKAKEDMRRWFINLPDQDLAYMPQGSSLFKDYCDGVSWAQGYARLNREIMMDAAMGALIKFIGRPVATTCTAVNCHHNYVAWERHFGENVIVTRKGAVSAQLGELGIIPGSMGAKSFIVRGKGNRDSFCSCSHGAGRSMSRTEARRRFTLEDHAAATAGVECRKDEEVIDETPAAYKSIEDVMRAQESLVEIVHTLRQVVCVKG